MPSKFAEGFDFDANNNLVNPTPGKKSRYFRKDGSLNETGKYILGVYSDERPEYSRQLNRLRTSSPEMAQAYAERFPVANFAMNMAPKFIPGIGPLFAMDQANKRKKALENVMNQKVNIPKDGFQNFVEFFKPEMNIFWSSILNVTLFPSPFRLNSSETKFTLSNANNSLIS